MALSYTSTGTWTVCREECPQVCDEIRLALAEVRRRTPVAGLRGTPGGRCSGPTSMGPWGAAGSSSSSSPHHPFPHFNSPTSPHLTSARLASPHLTSGDLAPV